MPAPRSGRLARVTSSPERSLSEACSRRAGYLPRVMRPFLPMLLLACAPKQPPAAPTPAPTAGLVEVKGVGARPPVREQLLRTLATAVVAPCYQQSLARDPRSYGEVVVSFAVGPDGRVDEAGVHLSTLGDAAAETCAVEAVRALTFPGVTAERLVVVYPFVFTSDATPPEVARALKVRYGLLPAEPEGDPADPKSEVPPGVVYLW